MITRREGLILYWCEGDKFKNGRYKVAVTAADFKLLRLFIEWLKRYYKVHKQDMRLRLHIWEDSNEESCKKYWSNKLKVPFKNFTKSDIRRTGKNKKYIHGICRVSLDSKEILNKILYDIGAHF